LELDIDFAFGLVTYLWGKDWDLPTLIRNCEATGFRGVELRTTHAHGVEPELDRRQRAEVKDRFAASPVELVGLGSDERFDSPDPDKLARAIQRTREFIELSHDVGGSGVKVKPDSFHQGVDRQQTIEQIGKSLNELAEFGEGFGQEIRLEVHGQCAELPIIARIMEIADHSNAGVCWNCNSEDLQGQGLEYNFDLVQSRLARTVHVRELNNTQYPYRKLFELLRASDFVGWVLLEARTAPDDRVAAMKEQMALFLKMNQENNK